TYAADVVVLIVNDSEACGIAAAIKATATSAFAVAHYTCITGYYSFAHEVGHLQGARHDRYVDSSTSPYAYGHGFIPSTKNWRTVMAYGNNCSNCTRIQWWSNPLKTYPSTGQVMGTAAYEDNARVLNGTAATVAAFR
ncbi:MAG TPA: M12 family metallo-peptidase, partial [Longimicrobiaceae bacterium]|nr:M12 family metallo-peptidase [Longimicrobiaceae bacterium]